LFVSGDKDKAECGGAIKNSKGKIQNSTVHSLIKYKKI
jgi:hypothetical protein